MSVKSAKFDYDHETAAKGLYLANGHVTNAYLQFKLRINFYKATKLAIQIKSESIAKNALRSTMEWLSFAQTETI